MKKVLLTIAMSCYLLLSIGVSVNFHYCMNKLDSMHFFATESTYCNKCGMHIQKSHGCCRDEVKVVKVEDDQNKVASLHFELPQLAIVSQTPSEYLSASFYNGADLEKKGNEFYPPPLSESETYLKNCVFRI